MSEDAITTVVKGKRYLHLLENVASSRFIKSSESFDRGMIALQKIRETAAWHYAVDHDGVMLGDYKRPKWEDYVRIFCDKFGIRRSTLFSTLNVVDTWRALGLPEEALDEATIDRAKEMRLLVKYDGRSGKLKLPPQEVLDKLPPADTPVERVKKKIEEVLIDPAEPLTIEDVRAAFKVDTGIDVDVHIYETEGRIIRYVYDSDDHMADGVLIGKEEWEKLDQKFKEWFVHKNKITEREG